MCGVTVPRCRRTRHATHSLRTHISSPWSYMRLNFVPSVPFSTEPVCSLYAKLCFAVLKCTKIYSLTLPSASRCRIIRRIRDRGQQIDEPNCETVVLCVLEISTRVLEYTQCTSRFSTETRVLIVYILNLVSMRGVFFPGHPAGNSKISLHGICASTTSRIYFKYFNKTIKQISLLF